MMMVHDRYNTGSQGSGVNVAGWAGMTVYNFGWILCFIFTTTCGLNDAMMRGRHLITFSNLQYTQYQ